MFNKVAEEETEKTRYYGNEKFWNIANGDSWETSRGNQPCEVSLVFSQNNLSTSSWSDLKTTRRCIYVTVSCFLRQLTRNSPTLATLSQKYNMENAVLQHKNAWVYVLAEILKTEIELKAQAWSVWLNLKREYSHFWKSSVTVQNF
jgi:hypothetical protein